MSSAARAAYHETLDLVESHQVTTTKGDQIVFLEALLEQLGLKLAGLLGEEPQTFEAEAGR